MRDQTATFGCNHKHFSLGTDVLRELTTDKSKWCNASLSKRKLVARAWRLAVEKKGDWSRMSLAWQSLLLEVGCILQDVAEKKTHLVYKITAWCPSLEEHEHHTTIECIDKSCSTPLVARAKFLCVLSMSACMHTCVAAIMDSGRESPWEEGSCQVLESNERKVSIAW